MHSNSQALSENTSGDLLRELAKSGNEGICLAVAQNPNTPTDVLLGLFVEFPLQVLNNPVLDLLLLETPNFLYQLYENNTSVLLKDGLPLFFLEWAIHHPDKDIRVAVAANPHIPQRFLKQLAEDEKPSVRYYIATNYNTPTQTLEQLAKDSDYYVRFAVANNPHTPQSVLHQLVQSRAYFISDAATKNLVRLQE